MKSKFKLLLLSLILTANADIIVKGNATVNTEKIKLLLDQVFDISDAKKTLYETGFFEKVDIEKDDKENYVITVKEKLILSKIVFFVDGKRKEKEDIGFIFDKLEHFSGLKLHSMIDKQKIKFAQASICKHLLLQGYKFINTRYEIIPCEKTNTVELHMHVDREQSLLVHEPTFIGIKNLDQEILKKCMYMRVENYVLFTTKSHEPYAQQQDFSTILAVAKNEGFLHAKIKSGFTETKGDEQFMYIVIEEGPQFEFRSTKIEVDEDLEKQEVENSELKGIAKAYEVAWLKERIVAKYKKSGQLVDVEFAQTFDGNFVDTHFTVTPLKEKVVISKIIVRGNARTVNEVILDKCNLKQGDYFDKKNLKKLESKLMSTGNFTNVLMYATPDKSKEKACVINIQVEEAQVAEIGLMGSAMFQRDHDWDFSLTFYYGNPNFLGRGHNMQFQITAGTDSDRFSFVYKVPGIFGKNISWTNSFNACAYGSGSINLAEKNKYEFSKKFYKLENETNPNNKVLDIDDADRSSSYRVKSMSAYTGLGFDLHEYGSLKTNFGFENQNIKVKSFKNKANVSRFFTPSMMPEERNIYSFTATHGYNKTFSNAQSLSLTTIASVNKSENNANVKFCPTLKFSYPLNPSQSIYLKGEMKYGIMSAFGQNDYWIDNFQSSEIYIKGIKNHGPTEVSRYTPIGGKQKLGAYLEFVTPFILPDEWNVSAFIGVYTGSVWDAGYSKKPVLSQYAQFRNMPLDADDYISNEFLLRVSASVGLRWQLGPFKLEVAHCVIFKHNEQSDEVKSFQFNITM